MLLCTDDVSKPILPDSELLTNMNNDNDRGNRSDPIVISVCYDTLDSAVYFETSITEPIN